MLDYTLDRQGPDKSPGVLPKIAYMLKTPLESRAIRLERAAELLNGDDRESAEKALTKIRRALERLERNYETLLAQVVNEIKARSREELAAENPFFNEARVLERVEASSRPEEDKAASRLHAILAIGICLPAIQL